MSDIRQVKSWRGERRERTLTVLTTGYELTHLAALEAESVYIFREVAATAQRPVLLFSGGKDSVVMFHVARKAFWPAPVPFPLMHVDTGHNFDEVIDYRDRVVDKTGVRLVVSSVQDDIDSGRVVEQTGPGASRNRLQTTSLLRGIRENNFDAVFGGARLLLIASRAKERVFSFRDEFGAWDPRAQRPELWNLYNGRHNKGEHIRVFPLSNWTELDIWRYIELEGLELPPIYFAHEREVFERDGILLATSEFTRPAEGEAASVEWVRYRTVGDLTITGAVPSRATTIADVVTEISASTVSERGETRADDRTSAAAMEDRKREGYF